MIVPPLRTKSFKKCKVDAIEKIQKQFSCVSDSCFKFKSPSFDHAVNNLSVGGLSCANNGWFEGDSSCCLLGCDKVERPTAVRLYMTSGELGSWSEFEASIDPHSFYGFIGPRTSLRSNSYVFYSRRAEFVIWPSDYDFSQSAPRHWSQPGEQNREEMCFREAWTQAAWVSREFHSLSKLWQPKSETEFQLSGPEFRSRRFLKGGSFEVMLWLRIMAKDPLSDVDLKFAKFNNAKK